MSDEDVNLKEARHSPEVHEPHQYTAEEAEANAARLWAETALIAAEADEARANADLARVKADREIADQRKYHLWNLEALGIEESKGKQNGVFPFNFKVSDSSVNEAINWLNWQHRTQPGRDLELVFYSPGGEVHAGMRLFDHIRHLRASGHKITTVTMGFAASMGGVLMQAGDTRVMGREAYILIHEISFAAMGDIGQVEDEMAMARMIQKRIINVFCERAAATGRKGHLTPAMMKRKWRRQDWWIDSDEAYRLGIVDEVR